MNVKTQVLRTKKGRTMLSLKYALRDIKRLRFIKEKVVVS